MKASVFFPYFFNIIVFSLQGNCFVKTKPSGNLDNLPGIGHRLARRIDYLVEMLGTALGVAKHAFLLNPHGGRQDNIGNIGCRGRIDIGNNDKTIIFQGTVPVTF